MLTCKQLTVFSCIAIFSYILLSCANTSGKKQVEQEEEIMENVLLRNYYKSIEKAIEYENLYNKTMELWPAGYKGYYLGTSYGKTWIHEIGDEHLPTLLLLHGMSGSSTMWYPNVEYLSKYFRVITPDIIGQAGKSLLEKPLKSSDDLVKWLDEVIINLNVNQIYLCGLSFGGWLAAKYTIFDQTKVKKLIMLDPAATLVPMKTKFFFKMFTAILIPATGESFEKWLTQGYEMNPDFSRQIEVGMMDYKNMKGQKVIFAKAIPDRELNSIKISVMVLIGDKSVIYDPKKAIEKAKKTITNVRAEIIQNCSHSMNMEQADFINLMIHDFINK